MRAAASSASPQQLQRALVFLWEEAQLSFEPRYEHVINEVADLLRAETDRVVLSTALDAFSVVPLTPKTRDFLHELIADAKPERRAAIAGALRKLEVPVTRIEWTALLEDTDVDVRTLALESLVHRTDQEDRLLLSRDLDGLRPFLDPAEISGSWVDHVAKQTDMGVDEVKLWYEERAETYRLKLTWRPG